MERFIFYGDHEDQFIRLHLVPQHSCENAASSSSPPSHLPVVAIIHGGFFKHKYNISNSGVESLLPSLLHHSFHVCFIEYERVNIHDQSGSFPRTNQDIILAINKLSLLREELHFGPLILLGHSAGGTLALWSCCLPAFQSLKYTPLLCVALAPIGNLVEGQLLRSVSS